LAAKERRERKKTEESPLIFLIMPAILPAKFKDALYAMPEYSYGVQRVVVTLDDGTKLWDVFVAGDNEIVKVESSTEVSFDPNRVVEVCHH
jgi:hypothetical protein